MRGRARRRCPAERATVSVTADVDGTDRQTVYRRAVELHEPLTADLERLHPDAVNRWSSDQLRVFAFRPNPADGIAPLMYRVTLKVEAEFTDFEQLSAFLDRWAAQDGVKVGDTHWDVGEDSRRAYEAALRADAVADAVAKAQAYATAVGRGTVRAVHLADVGMLSGDRPVALPRMARMADTPAGAPPALELRPDDIELEVAVDARFVAE